MGYAELWWTRRLPSHLFPRSHSGIPGGKHERCFWCIILNAVASDLGLGRDNSTPPPLSVNSLLRRRCASSPWRASNARPNRPLIRSAIPCFPCPFRPRLRISDSVCYSSRTWGTLSLTLSVPSRPRRAPTNWFGWQARNPDQHHHAQRQHRHKPIPLALIPTARGRVQFPRKFTPRLYPLPLARRARQRPHRGSKSATATAKQARPGAPTPLTHSTTHHYTTTALAPEQNAEPAAQGRTSARSTSHRTPPPARCPPATVPPVFALSERRVRVGVPPTWNSLGGSAAVPAAAAF